LSTQPRKTSCLGGYTIVAVDDNEDARELIGMTLSAYGANVRLAASVAEAFDAIEHHQPNLVLADLAMPGEDGYCFIRKLRDNDNPKLRRIPAIALTAYVGREDGVRLLQAGYQAHLAKPFELEELIDTAAALLGPDGA
jgi:CheY-like chemotaxis protein